MLPSPSSTRSVAELQPVQLWFTVEEWESLDEDDIIDAPPLALAFALLRQAEAVIDLAAVTGGLSRLPAHPPASSLPVAGRATHHVTGRIAVRGALGVQLVLLQTRSTADGSASYPPAPDSAVRDSASDDSAAPDSRDSEGVRLVVFPVALLSAEIADLVPRAPTDDGHPARHEAVYPYPLFLAGLAATVRSEAVLAEVAREIALSTPTVSAGEAAERSETAISASAGAAARQLTHLARDCVGRLEAVASSRTSTTPAVSWTLTLSGWFALTPVQRGGIRVLAVVPVGPIDLAAMLAPALASALPLAS